MESRLHHQKWRLGGNAGCDTTRSVAASCLISICRQAGSQSPRVLAEGGPGLEPVVPPSFGSNARCFGGDALVSLLVPDALLIAAVNCRITSRLGPPTPFPLRWTGSPPGDAAKTRRRFCGQPGCCSLVCDR